MNRFTVHSDGTGGPHGADQSPQYTSGIRMFATDDRFGLYQVHGIGNSRIKAKMKGIYTIAIIDPDNVYRVRFSR